MKKEIQRNDKYSLATISDSSLKTVTAYISADIHTKTTVESEAIAHIYTDALLSGTSKKTRDEFLNAVNILGASLGVTISGGLLTITLKSTAENFSKLLKLTEEMLTTPAFSSAELKRIKLTTKNELHAAKENSKAIAQEGLLNTLYGKEDRKYSYPIDSIIKGLSDIKPASLKKQHNQVLATPWSCSIAASNKQIAEFESVLKKIKNKQKTLVSAHAHKQKAPQPKLVLKSIQSRSNIDFSIGAPLPFTLHHPDYIALSLGLDVLAKWGGFSGRLMSTVREKEGLTYGIYGQLAGFSGTEQGYLRIMTFFAPDKAVQGLTSTFREITKIYKEGISEAELDKFKTINKTSQVLIMDSVGGQLAELHAYLCHNFTLKEMEKRKQLVGKLTLEEVNNAIKKYLDPKALTISGAGPTKAVQKELEKFIKNMA